MNRVLRLGLAAALMPVLLLLACQPKETVTFNELIAQPDNFNGKQATVEGFYFSGFEIVSLSDNLIASTYRPENLAPKPPLIWIEGNLGENVYNRLYVQNNTPSGYPEHFGKVKITGTFTSGGKYGHLDSYQYKITISKAELLPWSPSGKP